MMIVVSWRRRDRIGLDGGMARGCPRTVGAGAGRRGRGDEGLLLLGYPLVLLAGVVDTVQEVHQQTWRIEDRKKTNAVLDFCTCWPVQ